jgi:biopolymer transport protein TolQ
MVTQVLGAFGFALGESNLAGQIIVMILFVGSILIWTLMLTKTRDLLSAQRACDAFVNDYRTGAHPFSLYRKKAKLSPVSAVYSAACGSIADEVAAAGSPRLTRAQIKGLEATVSRTIAEQVMSLEQHMGIVATAASTAPFLGLLGTVWGVMDAFGDIQPGSTVIADVTPGIAGALLTTVVGLIVALPSSIGYNYLGERIRRTAVTLDNFGQELLGDFARFEV